MKDEIIKKILDIPLEKWNGYEAELNGRKIIYRVTSVEYRNFFKIDGIEFFGDEVDKFGNTLEKYIKSKEKKNELNKIIEIYNNIIQNSNERDCINNTSDTLDISGTLLLKQLQNQKNLAIKLESPKGEVEVLNNIIKMVTKMIDQVQIH